ncbi:phospholipase D family protein [Yoonia sp. 208BN28-4]|uniref:phospholipase D family protein n=1 Tax=Yoonia sp. 208BN28-4 TaxID=3126505 RepID=UPI0030961F5A
MPDFVNGSELNQRLSAALGSGVDADFAVAFWGAGAAEALGIQDGSGMRIVCNLVSGGTNPSEIRTLRMLGADVRQLNDLHAKIGVIGDMSFVGSSNMSTNGLGAEGNDTGWREVNVVYGNVRTEIARMFETFWQAATKINEADLEAAAAAWARRQQGNAVVAARRGDRSLVDVLLTAPAELDALNVRMVVYDTVTDANDLAVLEIGDRQARDQYGQAFETYWDWDSMTTDAATAYLVDYDWPARGEIARGMLYRRNAGDFPDFEQNGETFHAAYEIDHIEGITFGKADRALIRRAFHAYVRDGASGEEEEQRAYNFPISELASYLSEVG